MSTNFTLVPLCVDFTSPGDYFLFIFHIMAGVSTVLVAGSVVCGIISTRALLVQYRFLFMLNTSISDTLSGFGIFYQFLFDVKEEYPVKNWTFYFLPSLLGINIMTFLFAQIERYFAVCHPFFYDRFISTKAVVCVIIYSWIHCYGILLAQRMLPWWKAVDIAVYVRICVFVIIIAKVSMTIKLFFVIRFQLLRDPPGPERDSKKESLLIIIVVDVFFLLFWGPSMLYVVLSALTGKYVIFRNDAHNPIKILSRSNTLCTPSLYLWASPALRAAAWKTVWSKICKTRRSIKVSKV
ncbi:uncharacterized protein LOC106958043 [Poecilia latipinna]|uniref:uncharacterized protein LOC106958043 n=1 Tax=Poecilia latipinna TaxID=48699 RepID=UPI00072EE112|nr:PREDICTED: uncharacterized protein LOC106958043 [Poecilia latipinna]